jgi:uncharacterized repeat protein (TIGR01451 family)
MICNGINSARSQAGSARIAAAFVLCALVVSGCQNFQIPRIDPSGERLFTWQNDPAAVSPYASTPYGTAPPYNPAIPGAQPPLPGTTVIAPPVYPSPPTAAPSSLPPGISSPMVQSPLQTPQPVIDPAATVPTLPGGPMATGPIATPIGVNPATMPAPTLLGLPGPPQPGLTVSPARVVAPVGSEVVMIASLCGADGFMVTGENVEWMINRDGVGSFISPGERAQLDCLNRWRNLPRKVDNTYVLNTTLRRNEVLDRGTPIPSDDVQIQPGQSWVTVTSPAEGTTNLTVFAPNVPQWDRRQQSATIHWVDAQWNFPPPAINPVGTQHTFVTSVGRQTDGSPIAGWIVRYEVVGGPAAQWSSSGSSVIEVSTNELGQAIAELAQVSPAPGTNPVSIQIIRPGDANGGRRFVVGTGSTTKSWTQGNICINTIGPLQATAGSTVSYRLEVTNPSAMTARNVVVTDQPPRSLTFANSTPTADASPSGQEWKLGDLAPGELKSIDVAFNVAQAGNFNYCATVTADGGLTAQDCITTNAQGVETRPVEVRVNGPTNVNVGDDARYEYVVTNLGKTTITRPTITTNFEEGLEALDGRGPLEKDLADLQPGETSPPLIITFRVTRPGRLCQNVEVRSNNVVIGTGNACVNAQLQSTIPRVDDDDRGVTDPSSRNRADRPVVPVPGGVSGPQLTARKTGPVRKRVGETAEFTIEVTNTGGVRLDNIRIVDNYDTSLQPASADGNWTISGGSLVWNEGSLEPGKTMVRHVNCECIKPVRTACNRVYVTANGVERVPSEACLEISDGNTAARLNPDEEANPPAIGPPLRTDAGASREPVVPSPRIGSPGNAGAQGNLTVTIGERTDPVRIGGEVTYEIVVDNQTGLSDKDVMLSVTIPRTLTVRSAKAANVKPTIRGQAVQFEPIAELRPSESITFEIVCRAAEGGEGILAAEVTSQRHRNPVRAQEPTTVIE